MGRARPDRQELRSYLARDLGARRGILLALLHGSFPRGETFRDIDVAVWLDRLRLSKAERFRFALDLSVELRLTLGHQVDVQVLNDAPLGFRYHSLAGSPWSYATRTSLPTSAREPGTTISTSSPSPGGTCTRP